MGAYAHQNLLQAPQLHNPFEQLDWYFSTLPKYVKHTFMLIHNETVLLNKAQFYLSEPYLTFSVKFALKLNRI